LRAFLATCLCLLSAALGAAAQPAASVTPAPAPTPAPDVEPLVTEGVVRAPVTEIWRVFTTDDGYRALGVARADIDLRIGGMMRTTYEASASLGGDAAIRSVILAYEPLHMIATRILKPPATFPFHEAWKTVWTVVSMDDLGGGRTRVRVAMMGWRPDPESQAMRQFFRAGNAWVLQTLQSHYGGGPAPQGPAHAERPSGGR
jgi:uncharacterized protein YndB with AHSA1/START domain